MKITVVGCGNAGLIHAAKIYEKGGNDVCILKTSQTNSEYFDKIVTEGGYRVHDLTDRGKDFFVEPSLITRDAEAAMKFADIVLILVFGEIALDSRSVGDVQTLSVDVSRCAVEKVQRQLSDFFLDRSHIADSDLSVLFVSLRLKAETEDDSELELIIEQETETEDPAKAAAREKYLAMAEAELEMLKTSGMDFAQAQTEASEGVTGVYASSMTFGSSRIIRW